MLTTTLAKIRQHYGLAPNATLNQIDAAIDADTTPPATDKGADAGAEVVAEADVAPSAKETTEEATTDALTTEQVQAIVDTALASTNQAITDLNAANAELTKENAALSARVDTIAGEDADTHTGGKVLAATIVDASDQPWMNDPSNLKAGQKFGNK